MKTDFFSKKTVGMEVEAAANLGGGERWRRAAAAACSSGVGGWARVSPGGLPRLIKASRAVSSSDTVR